MNDYTDSSKYTVPPPDHSGLQTVPLSQLEPGYQQIWNPPPQMPLNPALLNTPQKEYCGVNPNGSWAEFPLRPGPAAEPKQRILGLSVKRFWIILIVLIVIIAGAIGAGVGVGLTTRSQADSTSPAASNQAGSSQEETNNTSPVPSEPASGPSTLATSSETGGPTPTSSTAKGGVSPVPTDGGCPKIDKSNFTPKDGQGKEIRLGSGGAVQTFVRHCETRWPAGPDWGNARVHDIMQFYVSCLEECIAACASYNRNYQNNVASGIGHYEGGLCRAVTVIKTPGENCYFKNDTGKVNTMGNPSVYSSAVLVMEDDEEGTYRETR